MLSTWFQIESIIPDRLPLLKNTKKILHYGIRHNWYIVLMPFVYTDLHAMGDVVISIQTAFSY